MDGGIYILHFMNVDLSIYISGCQRQTVVSADAKVNNFGLNAKSFGIPWSETIVFKGLKAFGLSSILMLPPSEVLVEDKSNTKISCSEDPTSTNFPQGVKVSEPL